MSIDQRIDKNWIARIVEDWDGGNNVPRPELLALEHGLEVGITYGRQISERAKLIKFITWVRNHYAVNAVIDNKGMVDFYLEQEKL